MSHFSLELFRDLYRYMEWADALIWRAALTNDAIRADDKVRELLHHVHVVQRFFLAIWKGESPVAIASTKATDFAQLTDLKAWAQPYYTEVRQFHETVDAAIFDRPVAMPWVKEHEAQLGMTFAEPTTADTMFQVVSHTTHHRAQINARLRALGGQPPMVDYIAWIWFHRPAADWELPKL